MEVLIYFEFKSKSLDEGQIYSNLQEGYTGKIEASGWKQGVVLWEVKKQCISKSARTPVPVTVTGYVAGTWWCEESSNVMLLM